MLALQDVQRRQPVARLEHAVGRRMSAHDARVHLQGIRIIVNHQKHALRRRGGDCIWQQPLLIERARQLGQLDRLGKIVQFQDCAAVL